MCEVAKQSEQDCFILIEVVYILVYYYSYSESSLLLLLYVHSPIDKPRKSLTGVLYPLFPSIPCIFILVI